MLGQKWGLIHKGHYPNLTSGAGQRFSSKTGYLVRFADTQSAGIVPIGDRIAP